MNIKQDGITPNAGRLLWAGFTAILAAGVGFGVRGGILANWASEFGFTGAQLGSIGAAGLLGFCPGIILGGLVVDKLGYGKLVFAAFLFHVLSAFVTFGAMGDQPQETAFQFLFWGTFTFAVANGVLEAVSNPLVATLFPTKRTHYLNILHASWPLGLVFGGLIGWTMGSFDWKIQLALFLIPTVVYGVMFMGQKMPKSEASEKGLSFGEMLKDVGILGGLVVCLLIGLFVNFAGGVFSPDFPSWIGWVVCFALVIGISVMTKFSIGAFLLFILFITHALVGAVELGTDGWIQNITGNILTAEQGKILFVFTSLIMFGLRFCADFIENKLGLSPVGLLFVCSVLAVVGLFLASNIQSFGLAFLALAVYALGKTFFWPTMLAVVGDRFPKSGAVAMSLMGGIGMMSAGLIGSVGLGFAKDKFASEALQAADSAAYAEYKAVDAEGKDVENSFFVFKGGALDGKKMGAIKEKLDSGGELTEAEAAAQAASIEGDRKTLRADAFIPVIMAVIYLLLLLYFKMKGGYRPVKIEDA
jgi:MFS family permease